MWCQPYDYGHEASVLIVGSSFMSSSQSPSDQCTIVKSDALVWRKLELLMLNMVLNTWQYEEDDIY